MDPSNPSSTTDPESIPAEVFADLNRTELYQLCRRAGLHVHPAWEREHLIQALQDAIPDDALGFEHPIDDLREALIAFITQHWKTLRPQLKCPAKDLMHPDPKKVNSRPCFGCSDMRVVACVTLAGTSNAERIHQLRRHTHNE